MLPALATEARARAMFEEEARLGALVEHPNVVRALGFGTEGGQPYLVLEYVPGVDLWRLSRWLTKHGRKMDVELVVFVLRELLAGLHAVHEARDRQGNPLGLVHRDVSPSNILLSTGGDVKLGDFGIAHARLREAYPQVALGEHARGKLGYLAPEQVCGQPVDRRTDVFAAAVIGAELFMGQPLFRGSSELAVLLAIRDAQVRPFVEYARSLPRGLGLAILAALARSPDDRTPTALALRDELEPFQGGDPVGLRAQLAALVREASADRKSTGVMPAPDEPATPSAHTEQTPAVHSEPTAEAHIEQTPAATLPGDPSTDIHEGVTGEAPELVCFVRTSQGQTIGPLSYAKVVEAIATGHFGITDTFAVGGGPFRPLQDHPDLFRHVPASSLSERTMRRDIPGEPDRHGSLENGGLIGLLGRLVLDRETGLLLCERAGVRKEVYLSHGTPEFVTSNLASELLGEFLVSRGVITRSELDMALAVMPRFEGRLGDTLTALGLVDPLQLFRYIAMQVQEKLLDLFAWNAGYATFWRGVSPPHSGFPLGLDPWRILIEGVDRHLAHRVDDPLATRGNAVVVAVRPPPSGLEEAMLPPSLRRILDAAEEPVRVSELVSLGEGYGRDPRAGRREIVLLLGIGALRWA
jgi:serine/threonine-protein kinase